MGHGLKALALIAILAAPTGATATTLITESCSGSGGTCISGVTGILIGAQHYNVDIRQGTFNDLNAAGLFPMFGSEAAARSAALALITFFNDVSAPARVVNDIGTVATFFHIPANYYDPIPGNIASVVSNCCDGTDWQTLAGLNDGVAAATDFSVWATFVRCEPFPGGGATGGCFPGPGPFPAPEPGTLALMGLGLFGIALTRVCRRDAPRRYFVD